MNSFNTSGYSEAQIEAAKKELFGDSRRSLYAAQGDESFKRAQAILSLKEDGVLPSAENPTFSNLPNPAEVPDPTNPGFSKPQPGQELFHTAWDAGENAINWASDTVNAAADRLKQLNDYKNHDNSINGLNEWQQAKGFTPYKGPDTYGNFAKSTEYGYRSAINANDGAANIDKLAYVSPLYDDAVNSYNTAAGKPIWLNSSSSAGDALAKRWQMHGQTPEQYKQQSNQRAIQQANIINQNAINMMNDYKQVPLNQRTNPLNVMGMAAGKYAGEGQSLLQSNYNERLSSMNNDYINRFNQNIENGMDYRSAADKAGGVRFDLTHYGGALSNGLTLGTKGFYNTMMDTYQTARKAKKLGNVLSPTQEKFLKYADSFKDTAHKFKSTADNFIDNNNTIQKARKWVGMFLGKTLKSKTFLLRKVF